MRFFDQAGVNYHKQVPGKHTESLLCGYVYFICWSVMLNPITHNASHCCNTSGWRITRRGMCRCRGAPNFAQASVVLSQSFSSTGEAVRHLHFNPVYGEGGLVSRRRFPLEALNASKDELSICPNKDDTERFAFICRRISRSCNAPSTYVH